MPNFLVIARREYMERVRTKSFIVMTALFPLLVLGVIVVPTLLLTRGSGGTKHFVVVASNAGTGETLRDELKKAADKPGERSSILGSGPNVGPKVNLVVDVSTDTSDAQRAALTEKVKQKQLDGVIFSADSDLAVRKISFYTGDISSVGTQETVKKAVTDGVRRNLLTKEGLTQPDIDNIFKPVELETQSPVGANPLVIFFTVLILVMIMLIAVLTHGLSVMQAIVEEKSSRALEVVLATARPIEMMSGKILGVGAVGLTQISIWAAAGLLLGAYGLLGTGIDIRGILSVKLMLLFGLFFLLGYSLYSTLCAALGAMVNSDEEAQQLRLPVMLPLMISALIMRSILQSPDSALAVWASLFPFTAPLDMFLRIAIQTPPLWQILLSIGLMIATAVALVFLCERIYRVGILMYGKRPTLPEIMKWIRYA